MSKSIQVSNQGGGGGSHTNQAVQPHKMARGLKFLIKIEDGLYYPYCKNKGADHLRSYCTADLLRS